MGVYGPGGRCRLVRKVGRQSLNGSGPRSAANKHPCPVGESRQVRVPQGFVHSHPVPPGLPRRPATPSPLPGSCWPPPLWAGGAYPSPSAAAMCRGVQPCSALASRSTPWEMQRPTSAACAFSKNSRIFQAAQSRQATGRTLPAAGKKSTAPECRRSGDGRCCCSGGGLCVTA